MIAWFLGFEYIKPVNQAPNATVDLIQNVRAIIGFLTILAFAAVYGEDGLRGDQAVSAHLAQTVQSIPNVA